MKNTEANRIKMIIKAKEKTEKEQDKFGYFGKKYVACENVFTNELLICTSHEAFNNNRYKEITLI